MNIWKSFMKLWEEMVRIVTMPSQQLLKNWKKMMAENNFEGLEGKAEKILKR